MRHAFWRMYQQKTASDSKADIKKETIMVTVLRLALISVVVSLLAAVPPVYAESRKHSTSKLWTFADTEAVPGARSRLFRSDDKICMDINTTLPEGAYTNWWFIFNSPENCEFPAAVGGAKCGFGDLANAAENSAWWATGGIVGPDMVGHFSACLGENMDPPGQDFGGPGLTDAQGAEIHLIVRYHCEAKYGDSETLGEQITMWGGGCIAGETTGGGEFGKLGTCPCTDLQFAIHPSKKRQHKDDDDD
jgi:hypothetical protein